MHSSSFDPNAIVAAGVWCNASGSVNVLAGRTVGHLVNELRRCHQDRVILVGPPGLREAINAPHARCFEVADPIALVSGIFGPPRTLQDVSHAECVAALAGLLASTPLPAAAPSGPAPAPEPKRRRKKTAAETAPAPETENPAGASPVEPVEPSAEGELASPTPEPAAELQAVPEVTLEPDLGSAPSAGGEAS